MSDGKICPFMSKPVICGWWPNGGPVLVDCELSEVTCKEEQCMAWVVDGGYCKLIEK